MHHRISKMKSNTCYSAAHMGQTRALKSRKWQLIGIS